MSSKPSLTSQLVADLLTWMQKDVVQPGMKLPSEAQLMREYAVSRTVVREAISQLQASGIVRTHQGKGSFVLSVPEASAAVVDIAPAHTLQDRLEQLEFRVAVEVSTAQLAATRHTQKQLRDIRVALDGIDQSRTSPAQVISYDFEFHLAIARASANSYFVQILNRLGTAMVIVPSHRLQRNPEGFDLIFAEHRIIYETIADRDAVAAGAAMRLHLRNSAQRLQAKQKG